MQPLKLHLLKLEDMHTRLHSFHKKTVSQLISSQKLFYNVRLKLDCHRIFVQALIPNIGERRGVEADTR